MFFLRKQRPQRSTGTYTLFPYTTLFRSRNEPHAKQRADPPTHRTAAGARFVDRSRAGRARAQILHPLPPRRARPDARTRTPLGQYPRGAALSAGGRGDRPCLARTLRRRPALLPERQLRRTADIGRDNGWTP